MFSNNNTLHRIGQIAALILVLSIEACTCKSGNKYNTANIEMRVEQDLLIGDQKNIKLTFQPDNSGNCAVIGDFKLKVNIVEQKTREGSTTGSNITYEEAANDPETGNNDGVISQPFEKLLTEFTNFIKLDPDSDTKDFEVYFTLNPADDAIKVKINFELLHANGESIQDINVEWIISQLVINPPVDFVGDESTFTIKNLKANIEDLSKFIVKTQTNQEGISFLLGENTQSEANLKDLVDIDKLAEEEQTNPIKITVNNTNNVEEAEFSILIVANEVTAGTPPIAQTQVGWTKYLETPETEELKKQEKALQEDEKQEEQIKEDEKRLEHEIKEAEKVLKTEINDLKKQRDKDLDELNKEKKQALQKAGKNKGEKKAIEDKYKEGKQQIEDKFKKDVADKQEKFKELKEKDIAKEKEDKEKDEELEKQIKEEKEREIEERKKIEEAGEEVEKDANVLPHIGIILAKRTDITNKKFTLELTNKKNELGRQRAEKIHLWYEVKNIEGSATEIRLKHGEVAIEPGIDNKVSLETLFEEHVYATWLDALKEDSAHHLLFEIEPGQTENLELIIHLQVGVDKNKQNSNYVTVHWSKSDTKNEKNKGDKENKKSNRKKRKDKKKR